MLIINVSLILKLLNIHNLSNELKSENNSLANQISANVEIINNIYEDDGFSLNGALALFDVNNIEHHLKDIVDGNKLILYLPMWGCDLCIEDHLALIENRPNKFEKSDVIVITSFESQSQFRMFVKANKFENIFNLKKSSFGFKSEETALFSLFILDNNLITHHFYTPSRHLPHISELFFDKAFTYINNAKQNFKN